MQPERVTAAMPRQIHIETIDRDGLAAWDSYVDRCPDASFFHRGGWLRVIQDSFGHVPHYLKAVDGDGEICGILPLFEVRSFLFGHYLVSVPFCVYGGAVADDADIRAALEDEAAALAEKLEVDYLELRNREKTRDDWPEKSLHATFIREIAEDDEAILLSIKNKQRAVVRKGLKNGLTRELQDDVEDFFHAYSTSVRNLGTPVFSRRYFANLKQEFGDDCEVLAVKKDGELHSGLISFYFRDHVLPYYGGGMPVSRASKAMDFMYYDQMCRARANGYLFYDFGRSKFESGPYNYKRHWGFEPQPLHYQYHLVRSDRLPELDSNNPRYQRVIAMWQKLPLRLSQWLGPKISRYLG